MKRFPILGSLFLIPAIALFALTGCPAKDKTTNPTTSPDGTKPAVTKTKITAPTDGKITGNVKLKGDKPAVEVIAAIAKYENGICEAGGGINVQKQEWIIDNNNGVANVVIWLEPAADKDFTITDEHKSPFKKPALIDQPVCQYVPHVVAVYAGVQPLTIKNSSKNPHNVKVIPVRNNLPANRNMTKGDKFELEPFKMENVGSPIKLACDIHAWMSGRVLTFDHPYFAVTKDDGSFTIANVPSGEELAVWMWHEEKGKWKAKDLKFVKGNNELPLEISVK